jgi:hypothetical protein
MLGLSALSLSVLAAAVPSFAQDKKEPSQARISIYRIAPGKHLDFLKWIAAQEEVAREAGVPATQVFAHTDGEGWDYIGIAPKTTPEQDKKVDEIAKKKGLKTGFGAGLEFRQFVASHSDTFAIGPMTAAELIAAASK